MFNLDLEKAKKPESKLPTSFGILKKQENSKKTSASASMTVLKSLTVCITANWKILKEMRIQKHHTYILRNLYASEKEIVRTGHGTMD